MKLDKWFNFILAFSMIRYETFSASLNGEIILANSSVEVKG